MNTEEPGGPPPDTDLKAILAEIDAEAEALEAEMRAALAESGAETDAVIAAMRAEEEATDRMIREMLEAVQEGNTP